MKFGARIPFFILFSLVHSSYADSKQILDVVRVRLDKDQAVVKITGSQMFVVADGLNQESFQNLQIKRLAGPTGYFWELTDLSLPKRKRNLKANTIQIMGSDLHRGSIFLPPLIGLHAARDKFDIVGELPIENYLIGVLASEMPLSWPEEALKAQAVAARSYTVAVAAERKRLHFDVESTIEDQVFRHVSPQLDEDPLIQKAKKAVQATQGLVVYAPSGNVLKAYYHSDCGGRTKSPRSVWGAGVNTGTATDAFCPSNPKAKWIHKISAEKLASKLNAKNRGVLEKLEVYQEAKTGLQKVRVFWRGHQVTEILGNTFRELLGYTDLRSLNFKAEKQEAQGKTEFVFRGSGFGHGVGMCQWGSRSMAQQGRYFDSILQHYYPLAAVGKKPGALPGFKISTSEEGVPRSSGATFR